MRGLEHVMVAIAPKVLEALTVTQHNTEMTIELTIQIRDDSNNAKVSQLEREDVLVDMSSGVRKSVKASKIKTDPQAVLHAVRQVVAERLFSGKVIGTAELTLCFKSGSFTKFEELKNQRSVFAFSAGQKGGVSDWVQT